MRMGLHSGVARVPFGALGHTTTDASPHSVTLDATMRLAALLQQGAEPDTILVSEATAQLIRGDVHLEDRGWVEHPGHMEPVRAYQVMAPILPER